MLTTTTVLIADDLALVRRNLRALIDDEPDLTVVGEAGSGVETIGLVSKLNPDVLVLDMMLGDITGIEVTHHVSKASPFTNVVFFSVYGDQSYISGAQQSGAKGYVLKKSPPDELLEAIRVVSRGGRHFTVPLVPPDKF